MPERIISDRGTAFTSKAFQKFCNENNVKHILNAVRTPRANGHAERASYPCYYLLLMRKDDGTTNYVKYNGALIPSRIKPQVVHHSDYFMGTCLETSSKTYNEGDLVLTTNEPISSGTSRKLEPRFTGPFIITKVLPNDRYVIEDLPHAERTQRHYKAVFASDQLKTWCMLPPDDPDDIDNEDESTMGEGATLGQESRL
ncbi:uncharacterized protein LOC125779181 [Bactrocera dorsalis]|uniref:Uncharacterized protein LOC125779181 n=1 Tax=Bactrocera dorsalis TaxID=27457 RepID=A0ABM3K2S4_BACDO|nr:uncharacterized protein LOC125779181 [Bactrocera dorsalis]